MAEGERAAGPEAAAPRSATCSRRRVEGATATCRERSRTLRQLNQAGLDDVRDEPECLRRTGCSSRGPDPQQSFESMRRIIDFEGAFCVVYDIKAGDISLSDSVRSGDEGLPRGDDGAVPSTCGGALVELAESEEHLPIVNLQAAIRQLFPGAWPGEDIMLMPLQRPPDA